jgi:hypothetical protein
MRSRSVRNGHRYHYRRQVIHWFTSQQQNSMSQQTQKVHGNNNRIRNFQTLTMMEPTDRFKALEACNNNNNSLYSNAAAFSSSEAGSILESENRKRERERSANRSIDRSRHLIGELHQHLSQHLIGLGCQSTSGAKQGILGLRAVASPPRRPSHPTSSLWLGTNLGQILLKGN